MKDYYYKPDIDPFLTYELATKDLQEKKEKKEKYKNYLKRYKQYERRRSIKTT